MSRYAMAVDLDLCVGCRACVVACKAENEAPVGVLRRRVVEVEGSNNSLAFLHNQCYHCVQPPCIEVCPSGATYQDDNGVVRLDREVCIGCGYCVPACPYEARTYSGEVGFVHKCDMCAHRLAEGLPSACVEICPAQCLYYGDLDDPQSAISQLLATKEGRVFRPDLGLDPKFFYVSARPETVDLVFERLPVHQDALGSTKLWTDLTRPVSLLGIAGAVLVTAIAFPIARRNALAEARAHEEGESHD